MAAVHSTKNLKHKMQDVHNIQIRSDLHITVCCQDRTMQRTGNEEITDLQLSINITDATAGSLHV